MSTITHEISVSCERGQSMLHGGHRAHCSCGWWSDCYAQLSDTQRAVDVHLRRSRRENILIARPSVGAALIDAHLTDQERKRSK